MKYLMREDARLTEAAKNVFGDIVSKAYSCRMYFKDGKPKKDDFSDIEMYTHGIVEIENGKLDICIEYTNGRQVLFTNSEWGSISNQKAGTLITEAKR